jgi:hypothetical protein
MTVARWLCVKWTGQIAILLIAVAACARADNGTAARKAIPMDGTVHILEQRGKFTITPTTLFCNTDGYVHPTLSKMGITSGGLSGISAALEHIGQPTYINGSSRWGSLDNKYCPDDGQNIIVHIVFTMNASGQPYRIEVQAQQGMALARVALERASGTVHPFADMKWMPEATRLHNSISEDGKPVDAQLTKMIFSNGEIQQ